VTAQLPARGRPRKHRRRRVRTKALVLLAVTASLLLFVGRGTAQVLATFSCSDHPVLLHVAASPDIAPAIDQIANAFTREHRQVDGRCVTVQVDAVPSSVATGVVDGQHPVPGQGAIDAWIPDSSLWVDEARGFAVGAQTVQPAGFSVARSPLMLVMPAAAAARTAAFAGAGWRLLLPRAAGGPAVPRALRVDLPDPAQSAVGLAALIEVTRLLGPDPAGQVNFTKFVYSCSVTPSFDNPASLASFVSQAAPPLDGMPVTVASEQAVIAYDEANPRHPLAARYPGGSSPLLGSPELDYPYVLTTDNPIQLDAAGAFGQMLRGRYAAAVIRYAGFRSGDGAVDAVPATFGLGEQLLQPAPPASPTEAAVTLRAWQKLALESRDLTLLDVSGLMARPAAPGGPTIEQAMTRTATLGLGLFPDGASIGLWEFAASLGHGLPYKQLVSIGPLSAPLGLNLTRRAELARVNAGVTPAAGQGAALYGSILAGYTYMLRTWQPQYYNALIVLTAGVENAPGDITARRLIARLSRLASPSRPVAIVIVVFGDPPDFPYLQRIAAATGGQAYEITNPAQVGKVFFQAIAHRLCSVGCVRA